MLLYVLVYLKFIDDIRVICSMADDVALASPRRSTYTAWRNGGPMPAGSPD